MNDRFIVASAMGKGAGYDGGTALGQGRHVEAILAIQQMICNVLASGKCTREVFVIGKSRGGGMALITAGLCPEVKDVFVSVPAMTGFNGKGGTTGAWPGYSKGSDAVGYVDACNHAKRIKCRATFSIAYNDNVTWGRGQVTAAKNTKGPTSIYHNFDSHGDPTWWGNGVVWLKGCMED